MPIRMFLAHIREQHALADQDGIELNQAGSHSEAQSKALTNSLTIGGVPVSNTISGAHSSSTSGAHSGNVKEQFMVGGLGVTAGINSAEVGTGFGINRQPGGVGVHLGSLNFGLSNHGGLLGGGMQNSQTQTVATSSASGAGATSSSQSNTKTNSFGLGPLINVQNTVSSSQAQSTSLQGSTSAVAGANSAAQSAQIPTVVSPNQISQQESRHIGNQQPGFYQSIYQQPSFPQNGFQLPGFQQPGFLQQSYPQPQFQPTG